MLGRVIMTALAVAGLAGPCNAWSTEQDIEAARLQGAADFRYESIAIARPRNDATVFDNSGKLRVEVRVLPALRSDSGDRIAILIDGGAALQSSDTETVLTGIARGTHTLQAEVLDSSGAVVLASPAVTFHMWQASKLFPGRAR